MRFDNPLSIRENLPDASARPFDGDRLSRQKLAEKLTAYIDRLKAGAVIGIDAAWGDGKSWFGRNWAASLRDNGHSVAFIDAFENDYIEDPFVLIAEELSTLLGEGGEAKNSIRRKAAGVAKALLPVTARAVLNLGGRALLGTTDLSDNVKDALTSSSDAASEKAEAWLEKRMSQIEGERLSIKSFRNSLRTAAERNEHPVVVFIDELDRCKPTFAVTLIERLKHLFDIPNLVFVLLLNRRQLEVAIEGQYGQGTDGCGYLGKFVDLWFRLPTFSDKPGTSETTYVNYAATVFSRYRFPPGNQKLPEVADHMALWASSYRLSLRDMERMFALYILADGYYTTLLGYLIALKIKFPELFRGLVDGNKESHFECSQRLERIIGLNVHGPNRELLGSLSEFHQISIGSLTEGDSKLFSKHRADTIGSRTNVEEAIWFTANRIDLPVENF